MNIQTFAPTERSRSWLPRDHLLSEIVYLYGLWNERDPEGLQQLRV